MRRALTLLLATLLLAPAATAATAHASSTGPCVPGQAEPTCTFVLGRVTFVADGDTIDVDLSGDGTGTPRRVRITGINATEQTVYSHDPARRQGECHALEATARLEGLIQASGGIVRLAAQNPFDHSGRRLRRSVAVPVGGQWEDVGRILVAEGHALWMPSSQEWAWNATYSVLAQQADAAQIGIWGPASCGFGPSAAVRLWVNWDAEGNDSRNPGGEWVKIQNLDPAAPLPLGGWMLRDSSSHRFSFPGDSVIPPGGLVTVHVGEAPPGDLGWNLRTPLFDNATSDERALGDGAYLFDPAGNMRASMVYPCRVACSDPLAGSVRLGVQARGRESVTLRDVADGPIDLTGYRLGVRAHGLFIPPGTVLEPGETLRVDLGPDTGIPDSRLLLHWPHHGGFLPDGGGEVTLGTYTGIAIGCADWGGGHC